VDIFFLSIELDVVMKTDKQLEEKQKLGKVRFSIRNCKTETMSSDEASLFHMHLLFMWFLFCSKKEKKISTLSEIDELWQMPCSSLTGHE
jgi:hypothetical protein